MIQAAEPELIDASNPDEILSPRAEEIVALCRALLRLQQPPSDIRRMVAAKYGIKPMSVNYYLSLARARNRSIISEGDENQFLSDSCCYWADQLRQENTSFQKAMALRDEAEERIDRAELILSSPNSTKQAKDDARSDRYHASRQADRAQGAMFVHRRDANIARNKLDDLLGLARPLKVANVTSDGKDVNAPSGYIPEPVDPDKFLQEFIESHAVTKRIENQSSDVTNEGSSND